MSTYDPSYTPDSGYTPTEDDIRAYNEDQARMEAKGAAEQQAGTPAALRHEWTEDGATFAVEDISGNVCLEGEQFRGGTITSNEAVLAREVLFLASELKRDDVTMVRLTDRLNALTARIEEALDLLIHETEGSRRVEQSYRMLEKAMMGNTTGGAK